MDETRPRPRDPLPFRVKNGAGATILEYEGTLLTMGGVKRMPYSLLVGNPHADPQKECVNPLGMAVFRTIQIYRALEADVDGLLKENEDLKGEVNRLKSELFRCDKRVEELKRRKA